MIANTGSLSYSIGGKPTSKEDLGFDSLCNGCISVGYARIIEYELRIRNEHIRNDYAAGESVTVLSRKYHLSEKSIRRILQKP